MESKEIFARTTANSPGREVSARVYNLVIGLVLSWGFFVNWLMLQAIPVEDIQSIHPILFILGYFVSAIAGIMLFTRSQDPVISFLGYNLVVIPFGLVINIVVAPYDPQIVTAAVRVTGGMTFIMMILGGMYPAFFQKISSALGIALIVMILVELIEIFFFQQHSGVIDWIVAGIFCGYIGYDWGRANAIPKTIDNAVDSAAALYMDIINLFLRVLRILGSKK